MPVILWVFLFGLLIAAVLLQDVPWLGISQTWGRNPAIATTAIVVAFAIMTLLMSVAHVAGYLP